MSRLHQLRSHCIGLALSGGSVQGLAHLGVVKVLSEAGIRPTVITETRAGSLIAAMLAAGMERSEIASLAAKHSGPNSCTAKRLSASVRSTCRTPSLI